MPPSYTSITAHEIDGLSGLDDWRVLTRYLHASFRAPSFPAGAALVAAIAEAAERAEHHPDVELRYPGRLHVSLTTHAVNGLTTLDVDLARAISSLAAEHGASSDETWVPQEIELGIDTMDAAAIAPFWAAVLGYVERDGELVDPVHSGPMVWFQQMDAPRPDRNRVHVDVIVPHDVADTRVAAALAAGGRLVSAEHARSWWVLADAEGNEACVCTWEDCA